MSDQSFPFHDESTALTKAPVNRVFAYLDDPKALAAHMGESSMMMGSGMSIGADADDGRVVGSKIRMHGSMMGFRLSLEEAITERQVPTRNVWETIGTLRLLVMVYARWCTKQMASDAAKHLGLDDRQKRMSCHGAVHVQQ